MKSELPKPLAVGGIVLVVVLVLAGGFFLLRNFTKGDLDGQVVHPKPWAPPGGAAAFKGAGHGAPASQPSGQGGIGSSAASSTSGGAASN